MHKLLITTICRTRSMPMLSGLLVLLLGLLAPTGLRGQTIPAASIVSTQTIATIAGNSGHVAVNSLGDVFYLSTTDKTVYEIVHGTATPVAVVTGVGSDQNVYIDPYTNNLWVPALYSSSNPYFVVVPYVNGGYTPTADSSLLAPCPLSPAAITSSCSALSAGSPNGYIQPTDITRDANGNFYVSEAYENGGATNRILEWPSYKDYAGNMTGLPDKNTTAILLASGLPHTNAAQITTDSSGNVYYVDGTNIYMIPKGTTTTCTPSTCTRINSSVTIAKPAGISVDRYNNLYVTDNDSNAIFIMPASPATITGTTVTLGTPQPSKLYKLAYYYSANGVGIDPVGRIFYTGYSGGTNLNIATPWSLNLGSTAIGTTTAAKTLSVTFSASATLTGIALTSASASSFAITGGTCAVATAYSSGSNCTITVTYTPTAVGLQKGAIILSNASGVAVATAYLSGTGLGAAQVVDPGTASAIGTGWKAPAGMALDTAGNLYVADTTNNAVYRFASGSSTGTTVGSGLTGPTGVAVDGAGNLFIGDSGNGRVVEVPIVSGALSSSAQSTVFTGTNGPTALASDSTGSLYIGDSSNRRVLKLVNTAGTLNSADLNTVGSGFTTPVGLATDTADNLYIADQSASSITRISPLTGSVISVGAGLSQPGSVAVDPSGSVYVVDAGNLRVIRLPYEGGSPNTNDLYRVGLTIAKPANMALDSVGNIYVDDSTNATVTRIVRTQGTLDLGSADTASTTAQLTSVIGSAGTNSLTLGSQLYTQFGSTGNFTITSPSSGGCTANLTLTGGSTCTVAATFTPSSTGVVTDMLTFPGTNAANTITPQLLLTGTGTNLPHTAITVAVTSPTGTPAYGQSVSVAATLTYTSTGTAATGKVTFVLNGQPQYPIQTISSTGTASFTLGSLNAGINVVSVSYSGDTNYASSTGSLSFTVAKASTTTTLAVVGTYHSPESGKVTDTITMTATVVPSTPTAPTQTVTFYYGTTALGTAAITPSAGVYTATATTTALPAGTDQITAVYGGDVNYNSSTSTPQAVIIGNPGLLLTPLTSNLTVPSSGTGTLTLTVSSLSGFSGTVVLSCSGLPANSACSIGPNAFNLAGGTPQTLTLEILTGQVPVVAPPPIARLRIPGTRHYIPISLAFLLIAPLGYFCRGRKLPRLAIVALLMLSGMAFSAMVGCGSGFDAPTPAGQYPITITASGTGVSATATVNLTVTK